MRTTSPLRPFSRSTLLLTLVTCIARRTALTVTAQPQVNRSMRNTKNLLVFVFVAAGSAFGQASAERMFAEQAARLKTDDRIAMYGTMIQTKPENLHYQNLLAGSYIQKMRESTDFSYLDRAAQIVGNVISADSQNYEALRLRSEIELERHHFKLVADYSRQLMTISPNDPWNWGTLGDALLEM